MTFLRRLTRKLINLYALLHVVLLIQFYELVDDLQRRKFAIADHCHNFFRIIEVILCANVFTPALRRYEVVERISAVFGFLFENFSASLLVFFPHLLFEERTDFAFRARRNYKLEPVSGRSF